MISYVHTNKLSGCHNVSLDKQKVVNTIFGDAAQGWWGQAKFLKSIEEAIYSSIA